MAQLVVDEHLLEVAPGEVGELLMSGPQVTLGYWKDSEKTAAAFVIGLAMNVAQVGFMFTLKPITPDIKKINPVSGVKNLVNKKKLVELLKTTIKRANQQQKR